MVICHTSSNTLGGRVGGVRCDSNMLAYIVTGLDGIVTCCHRDVVRVHLLRGHMD